MTVEYEYKEGDDWKISAWPWVTLDSLNATILDGTTRQKTKNATMRDAMQIKMRLSSMFTGMQIGKQARLNTRVSSEVLRRGMVKGAKDLFTAGCSKCGSPGEKIDREDPRFSKAPPGLYCPKCDETFLSRSIVWREPVFLVAAGPSLDKNVEELKRVKGKYKIFAVDTALPSLLRHGVKPDFCLSVEVDPLINEMELDTEGITLVATLAVDPDFRRNWKGPVYFVDTPSSNKRERKNKIKTHGDTGWASPGGNVSTVMFSMVSGMFPSCVILIGHDFSYPHLQNYYPEGGPQSMVPLKPVFKTHDIFGQEVYTDSSLYGYKDWTETAVRLLGGYSRMIRFVNATEGGILGATYYDPQSYSKLKQFVRKVRYRSEKLIFERRWADGEEIEGKAFRGDRLDFFEYETLEKAIDKFCPLAREEI